MWKESLEINVFMNYWSPRTGLAFRIYTIQSVLTADVAVFAWRIYIYIYIYMCVFTMLALDCGMVSEGAHSALSMVEAQRL